MKYLSLIILMLAGSALSGQTIPQDAYPKCPVDQKTFDKWFLSGNPSVNGFVKPADSVGFSESSVCDFYAWSKQMFLWLTSQSAGTRVFDSSTFYDVSPADSSHQRKFLPHGRGPITHLMAPRFAKEGPHGLPIIEDKSGDLFEVVQPSIDDSGKQIVVDNTGSIVEVSKASITGNHKLAFQDRSGKNIELPSPTAHKSDSEAANAIQTAREFIVNGRPVFVDSSDNIIDVDQGQAGSFGVLESQTDGLVYYLSMTNDVYAYFLTGVKNDAIPATQFPTTKTDLDAIERYAAAHGKPGFTDAQALTLELKSSWIEVDERTKKSYITTTATIPTYNKSDPKKWIPNGEKQVTLGLLGLHIVGSVAGHPEMIWATFEHFGDTPNALYSYINAQQLPVSVPQSTAGTWGFSASNSTGPFNVAHMKVDGANIVAESGFSITPSDSLRVYPWGAAGGNASANTFLISIQNSISALMPKGDIRSNYFLVGATWTTSGNAPPAGQAGATNVANSTLETYTQKPGGCFLCHVSRPTPSLAPNALSHIFGGESTGLQPLFPSAALGSK
ncbi:hypothetical protein HNQ77_003819 [Silvibacterium bohemicum]|uniref:Cytochrome c domain-containing protein n=1 Tax=Silvibacterium bohemicum TaxID=1577686 RepID=A0A841K1L7_9BACT|nr:hypothetical protein [Silvibacterium bohemicum]MBB6145849.1 hypothetical protein [Silvibacterium bohemicum]